ncbi:MAG: hydroxyacylglutathione hydrolase [Siculibacillus sp.]|nr:hydroxyacylglutathione hydrolase [Siculibacillus sp.]
MIEIRQFPARDDNYAVLIHDTASGATASIDAPEEDAILDALEETGWRLTDIFVTHHHYDHVEAVAALKERFGVRVVASAHDAERGRVPLVDRGVVDGEHVFLGATRIDVIAVPGHTLGHVAYHIPSAHALFAGDTLFALGCGRLFEGTAGEMWASLKKLRALPSETLVYCGHEYTQGNARFALTVEPGNAALAARARAVEAARDEGLPTVPSKLVEEIVTNPFLRADVTSVKAALGMLDASDEAVFAEIRERKNRF